MGHRLPSYDGVCASMHGHNIRVEVDLYTPEFLDFKEVDETLRTLLSALDHSMVLYQHDEFAKVLSPLKGQRLVLLSVEPTTENIAQLIFNGMKDAYTGVTSVLVHETSKYSALANSPMYTVHFV
jgi:6-pyruvoyltetrahydropterin/6-carboxytetrahydropterin synthase